MSENLRPPFGNMVMWPEMVSAGEVFVHEVEAWLGQLGFSFGLPGLQEQVVKQRTKTEEIIGRVNTEMERRVDQNTVIRVKIMADVRETNPRDELSRFYGEVNHESSDEELLDPIDYLQWIWSKAYGHGLSIAQFKEYQTWLINEAANKG